MSSKIPVEWAPMLLVVCILVMLLACCAAPQSPVNELPPIYMPRGEACGIWATDHRHPNGGLLPERSQDDDPTDSIGVAVHYIIDVDMDSWSRPTRYMILSISRHSGETCTRWVPATVFNAWRYEHPYREWLVTASDFIRGTAIPKWSIGDSIPITCTYYPDSIGLKIRKWDDVPAQTFRPCF